MKKFISLAVVLISATSLTTSTFAGRGSEEPSYVPVVPIVTPIPQDPTPDVPDSNDPANDQDDNAQNPQQGFTAAQTAGIATGAAAGALAAVGAGVLAKKVHSNYSESDILIKRKAGKEIIEKSEITDPQEKKKIFETYDKLIRVTDKMEKESYLNLLLMHTHKPPLTGDTWTAKSKDHFELYTKLKTKDNEQISPKDMPVKARLKEAVRPSNVFHMKE